ncbi:MAG: helix-turn-helix domain-containing protein, partial [Rickettsiales bacterium]|nr:helix-turn-helix domain-containing protein [Rickettsiales bacterium]
MSYNEKEMKEQAASEATNDSSDLPARKETVGSLLRAKREELGRDIQEISAALRIKPQYLSALEDDKYSNLPGAAYAIGFIRTYADYLGLDPQKLIDEYKAADGAPAARAAPNEPDENTLIENPVVNSTHFILLGAILCLGMLVAYMFNSRSDYNEPTIYQSAPAQVDAQPAQADAQPAQADVAPAIREPSPPPADEPKAPDRPDFTPAPAATLIDEPESDGPVFEPNVEMLPVPSVAKAPDAPRDEARGPTEYGSPSGSRIKIAAKGRVWIKLKRDGFFKYDEDAADNDSGTGEKVFESILEPGDVYHVPDSADQFLSVGNAQLIDIYADGKIAPPVSERPISRHNIEMDAEKLRD